MSKTYTVKRINADIADITSDKYWEMIKPLKIEKYLWIDNGYRPHVEVKAAWSAANLYVYFKVHEKKICVRHTQYGSDVWKDSCVELFINPFPEKSNEYINIEINAMGTMLAAKGKDRYNRQLFPETAVSSFEVVPSVTAPIDGYHGAEYWTLHYKIPLDFFETAYKAHFTPKTAAANFYKCGDETEYVHYGVWNEILSEVPDFHQPRFFGKLIFSED